MVVAVRVGDDQGLVPGKEVFRELFGQRVRLVRREPMIRRVPGVEADDEVVGHDVAPVVVLVELVVQLDAFRVEGEGVAVHAALDEEVALDHVPGLVAQGPVRALLAFEDQVLLDVGVVLFLDGQVFKNRQADRLPA